MSTARHCIPDHLIPALEKLRSRALRLDKRLEATIARVHPAHRLSARNLVHYMALRQQDNRQLQQDLALLGLSRLGRAEAHVMESIEAVLEALYALTASRKTRRQRRPDLQIGGLLLNQHTHSLLGSLPAQRAVHIMVTMPSEAATDASLVESLLAAGMDIMRINCAHDGPVAWQNMIRNLRLAEQTLGRRCKVYADLAGPKLRTGAIASAGRYLDFGPRRDVRGQLQQPGRAWLTPRNLPDAPGEPVDAILPMEQELLERAHVGDLLELDDSRGARRVLTIRARHGRSLLATCTKHVYLADGAPCRLLRGSKNNVELAQGKVSPLPEVVLPLLLRVGDRLLLTPEGEPGGPAITDSSGRVTRPAHIPCTLPAVFGAARPGHHIWFDDGKIGGLVRSVKPAGILVEITRAAPKGSKLRPEKGINLPDTELGIPALTEQDRANLGFVAPMVDMVGLSFVRRAADVAALHAALEELGAEHLGTVLKIETRQAFENLPRILLEGLRYPPLGIMLARGDLAVEVGFERLSELQEEILWLCEAAHVPVIWATQVLESMAKRGLPSRAEVSDAAMSGRAECVMLNKGPYIVDTVGFLSGVLTRMNEHLSKRRPMLRKLAVSRLKKES
jgi:pyruvate kinase